MWQEIFTGVFIVAQFNIKGLVQKGVTDNSAWNKTLLKTH